MAIVFRCPGCDSPLQIGAEYAGQKVRCPRCQTITDVPVAQVEPVAAAAAAPAPAAEQELAVVSLADEHEALTTAPGPARGKPRPGPAEGDHPRPRQPVQVSRGAPVALIVAIVLGGGLLFSCGIMTLAGWWLFSWKSVSAPPPPAPPMVAEGPDVIAEGPIPFPGPPIDGKKDRMPENPPPPIPQPPPVQVPLAAGKAEIPVAFKDPPGPRTFLFDVRAGAVYWVQVKDGGRAHVRVEVPGAPRGAHEDRLGRERSEVAFLASRAGPCTVRVQGDPFDQRAATLVIREMDGKEPLPAHLRIKTENKELPRIEKVQELNVYDKQFSTAAFAPDSKSFWMAHGDGTLSYWLDPAGKARGHYKLGAQRFYALAVDGTGRLYAQASRGTDGRLALRDRTVGDILVWEGLRPDGDAGTIPAPTRTISLRGLISRFVASPDGKWLYFLDIHNRKLGRIDTATANLDRTIDTLSTGTASFCLTPNGKRIYVCSRENRLDVIDTATFKVTKTVRLDRGQPTDVAASNEGLVFLVGARIGQWPIESNGMVTDLTGDLPDEATVIPVPVGHHCQFVLLMPDQRAALFSGDRRVTACSLPSRPALFAAATREGFSCSYFMPGQIILAPDGRTLLHDTGVILSVSR